MPFNVPLAGGVATAYVKVAPSTSVPAKVRLVEPSSATVTVWAVATGASFTALTVIETVAAAEPTVPSFTVNVKLSLPAKFSFGV